MGQCYAERTCILLVTPGHPFTDDVHEGTESPWTQWVGVQQDSCENRAAMCHGSEDADSSKRPWFPWNQN